MSEVSIDTLGEVMAKLGECPVWSPRDGWLTWIDIDGRQVHRTFPDEGHTVSRTLPGRPGSLALTSDPDRLLISMEHELVDFRWSSETVTPRVRLEADGVPTRMNDGRADPAGRFFVGSMDDPSSSGRHAASFHRIEPDGRATVIEAGGVGVSNGLAFSPDGSTMYWADTRRELVWAYDYDVATGERRNQRIFLDFATLPGKPDGACVDEDGCYWVACVYGWAVLRATPDGRVDRIVEMPVEKPSMPAFGGSRLDELFVTSINSGGATPAGPGQPLAGALFVFDPGVRGLVEPLFAG